MQSIPSNPRAPKLRKVLDAVLSGRTPVQKHNYCLFIEAICADPSPTSCIARLISQAPALISLQTSFTIDLSISFLNGPATDLLRYLRAPELISISSGTVLRKILLCIVDPPLFWDEYVRAYEAGLLHGDGCISYAWLLLQLISLDRDIAKPYRELAQKPRMLDSLLDSPQIEIRNIGSKIKHILSVTSGSPSAVISSDDFGPGGRHDNDFPDFHDISILPTADEILCTDPPFLRRSSFLEDPDLEDDRLAAYTDNQFRLLREDMLYEMREETQNALGKKRRPLRNFVVDGLTLLDIYISDDSQRRSKWGITFQCLRDLPQFHKVKPDDRRAYLNDNRKIFRHQSQACLIVDNQVVAFPTVNRVEDLLAQKLPIVVLQLEGDTSITKTLLKLKTAAHIKLVQIDSAIFSFEPILNAIKDIQVFPLSPEILFWKQGKSEDITLPPSQGTLSTVVESIRNNPHRDLREVIGASKPVLLDQSQADSLLAGLTQKVSLIQGPPGTGKSFIGALLAKVLHDSTDQKILVVCYTNHALDQFLEDLLDIGIPKQSIVRMGSKHSTRTEPLSLQKQSTDFKFGRTDWTIIENLKNEASRIGASLSTAFNRYTHSRVTRQELLEHLEFEDAGFYEAFRVPRSTDGMTTVGRRGLAVNDMYLLNRWASGIGAGIFARSDVVKAAPQVWGMPNADRQAKLKEWDGQILKEQAQEISALGEGYNKRVHDLQRKFSEKDTATLRSKRIIGCTTTAAAMYRESIQAASPNILLVEEAGEILESHVLTALSPETTQLILIGDHKQLRPKVNHYLLTVEKGEGYDLNRSLFERLVLKGYPHKTLTEQHRMRPEISALIRQLTYPELVDADSTKSRPDLRGLRDNIVFINHDHPEDELTEVADKGDVSSSSSKQNTYEVEMVLKIVRYLAQQGYGTEKLVILTPYLGQLLKLRDALKKDNDPVLNDLDSYDLVRAGLLPAATASVNKNSIRLSTIDNYQGEESDIVIGSLTRSNASCNIGFMSSPERLNVLLSRARDGLILLGNSSTFLGARNGKDLWNGLFTLLKTGRHIYDGLPVKCERHPGVNALLSQAIDFDTESPDGGCKEPCTVMLNCGIHICPSKCHQLYDHSKMPCNQIQDMKCPKGHLQIWKCHQKPPSTCYKCVQETKLAEKKKTAAAALQRKRDAEDLAHAQKIADLDEKIATEAQANRDRQLAEDRAHAIQQKQKDLEAAISRTSQATATPPITARVTEPSSASLPSASKNSQPMSSKEDENTVIPRSPPKDIKFSSMLPTEAEAVSPSQKDWQRRKEVDGASNDAIDSIMELIGLEDVKAQVLRIYAKIELTKRQGISLKDERFNIVLLGNPGTGKTTVARHYAKFLSSVEVLPGSEFVETTGSRLANEGVAGIKKHLETIINAGGGAIFVDETYQLTGEYNFQGSQVLDFMLAEMENHIGTIVFIFAGYDEEMEKFFEHNPGLTSRVPYKLHFADYSDGELLSMLDQLIRKKYGGRMKVEDGVRGLYGRIAIRRLGRGRGREGFGNARALRNLFAKVGERQAQRVHRDRTKGLTPDDFVLLKEDLIGPDPSDAIVESTAWRKLQSLIGLAAVKQSIKNFLDLTKTNYERELVEKEPIQVSLNRVFLGSPGTGKTTVAKLYGQILSDLGLLSGSEVVMKNPADFIGSAVGESEKNTKAILANTVGKVLIIDEAYMLYSGSDTGNHSDSFKTAVIDTIVAEVQSVPGEDRCVLLLGYKHQIVEMFQNVNPGLSRRFAIENAFHFDDFTDTELLEVLNMKLKDQHLEATAKAKTVAIEVLSRSRNRPNFGNAGEVENLLGQAKARYQTRQALLPINERNFDVVFDSQDFDPDHDRSTHAAINLQKLFEDVVGCEDIVRRLGEYQQVAAALKARNIDARGEIPMNFVFKGPPGTGKTTTARKMGQVYFDMGFLSSVEVVECSASDLVGQYVGQTGPKTQKIFEKALGRVLFIDEAYRLSEGHFAKEAMDELVGALTLDKFKSKIVVILAGYDKEMNELMAVNTGLSSRFPDEITFHNMEPEHCLEMLKRELKKKNIRLKALENPASSGYKAMSTRIEHLSRLPSWGNARDVMTLSKNMVNTVYKKLDPSDKSAKLSLSENDALSCMNGMLSERLERTQNLPTTKQPSIFEGMREMLGVPTLRPPRVSAKTETKSTVPKPIQDVGVPYEAHSDDRDAGVSEEIWRELILDKEAASIAAKQLEENTRQLELELEEMVKQEESQQALMKKAKLDEARAQDDNERDRLRRQQEKMRIQEVKEKMQRERVAALLEEERMKKRQEANVQQKLRTMGVCVAGYRWIKQTSGYRCAGGFHFVDNATLGI